MRKSIITSALLLASLISCNCLTMNSTASVGRHSARTSAITNRPTATTSKP